MASIQKPSRADGKGGNSDNNNNNNNNNNNASLEANPLSPRNYSFLFGLAVLQLCISVLSMCVAIAVVVMQFWGSRWYDFKDSYLDRHTKTLVFIHTFFAFSTSLSFLYNLYVFRLSRLPNDLFHSGCVCILNLTMGGANIHYQMTWYKTGCPSGDLEDAAYPATLQQCRAWEATYMAVCWTMYLCVLCFGMVNAVFLSTVLKLRRSRLTEQLKEHKTG